MEKIQMNAKKPISKKTIFKVMLYATYIVAGAIFIKNIIAGSVQGMLVVGIALLVFTVMLLVMKGRNVAVEKQQAAVSMSLVFLVFIISLFSGEAYSDDFLLYLAVIGLTGMYLRPRYTAIQAVLCDILLAIQYLLHPEKAESLGQFIMCCVMFTLAAFMFYMAIKRGRGFIRISERRAEEAERLLNSLKQMGGELEKSVESSTEGIAGLKKASCELNSNADELKQGSVSISQGTQAVSDTCEDVHIKIQETEKQVDALTDGVHNFEDSLKLNRKNMDEMSRQMETVQETMNQADTVFHLLAEKMQEIVAVTEQLNGISSSTTMLALNASIEAARAGQSGAGFAVVANKVQQLAVDSNQCSGQVADVVAQMQKQIQDTTEQMTESGHAINESLNALQGLQNGFDQLTQQFDALYQNIELQNNNINQMDDIFDRLKNKVAEMNQYSSDNQEAVEAIAEAMLVYQESMKRMIDDTNHVNELSASMLNFSGQQV